MSEQRLIRVAQSAVTALETKADLTTTTSKDFIKNELFYVLSEDALYRCTADNKEVKKDSDFVSTKIPVETDIRAILQPSLDSETAERKTIKTYSEAELAKLDSDKLVMDGKVTAETTTRTAEIVAVKARLDSEELYVKNSNAIFNAKIEDILLRLDSDKVASSAGFAAKIAEEQIARVSADATLTGKIDSETLVRTTQFTGLDTALAAEVIARASADSDIKKDIATAIADYTAKINVQKERIDLLLENTSGELDTLKEIGDVFQAADSDIKTLITLNTGMISASSARIDSDHGHFVAKIGEEAARITAIDNQRADINSRIDSEIALRILKVAGLDTRITQENSDRIAAILEAEKKVEKEEENRVASYAALDPLIKAEELARAKGDSDLRALIINNTATLQTQHATLVTEIAKFDTAKADLLANDSDLDINLIRIWTDATEYKVGNVVLYSESSDSDGTIGNYKALVDHTAASGNKPSKGGNATWQYVKSQDEVSATGSATYFVPSVSPLTDIAIEADSEGAWIDTNTVALSSPAGTLANIHYKGTNYSNHTFYMGGACYKDF